MAWFLLFASWSVYYFGMDVSEFVGLEPVSKHELDTLLAHLPNGALGRFELRLILRVRELENALEPTFDGTCELFNYAPDPVEVSLGGLIRKYGMDDVGPIDTSSLGEETAITIDGSEWK